LLPAYDGQSADTHQEFEMKIGVPTLAIAGVLAFASAGAAQPASPTLTALQSISISNEDVQKFASAAVALGSVQSDTSITQAEKAAKMVAAVQQSGLDPQQFNTIAQAAQTDPVLQKKIQVAAAAASLRAAPQPRPK
jgi:hypothetical protein